MKYINTFDLFEAKKDTLVNEFGCLMLSVPKNAIAMSELHELISMDDLYESDIDGEYGFEKEPHTTVIFGLHDDHTAGYAKMVLSCVAMQETTLTVTGASIFESDDYDVVKLDITSKDLVKMNKYYAKHFDFTCEYKYHPHLTIAYVKKGKGKSIAKLVEKKLKELELLDTDITSTKFVYSRPKGERIKKSVLARN